MLELLRDWQGRATASSEAHYDLSTRLSKSNIRFGVPVVALTTVVGTSVFATLSRNHVNTGLQVAVGMLSVLAAVLASLQTFLRFGERARSTALPPSTGRLSVARSTRSSHCIRHTLLLVGTPRIIWTICGDEWIRSRSSRPSWAWRVGGVQPPLRASAVSG